MIVLITGGSRGIGAAIVEKFKSAGHTVANVSRTKADCDLSIHADLTQIHDRYDVIRKVIDVFGGIDVLINNAGIQGHSSFCDVNNTELKISLELMLIAPFDLSQQAAKHMLRHGGGHIINIISTSAFQGARYISPYVVAKHGLLGLTKAMAVELAPLIHVNAIAPGLTETDMTREYITQERHDFLNTIIPAGRFGKPEEIARAALWLATTEYVYGQTIVVDGGWLAKNG